MIISQKVGLVNGGQTESKSLNSILPEVHQDAQSNHQIRFSINTHGKDKTWDFEKLNSGFQDKTGTLKDLVDHVRQGHALCAGLLGGKRRAKANVIGSKLVLLDIDNSSVLLGEDGKPVKGDDGKSIKVYDPQLTLEQALVHPFIQQYCALMGVNEHWSRNIR